MEKNPIEVMTLDSETGFFDGKVPTLDSESEDELQILSENITNYGNYSKPVEISPELQEKILQSLQKSAFPGKIQSLKIVATKTKNNEKGTVRASFNSANGISHVINVGPDFKENFVKQVQGEINNNVDSLALKSNKYIGAKRTKYVSQSRSNNPEPMRDDEPLFPIRKIKKSHLERKNSKKTPTKNLMPQIETITIDQNPLNSASSPPNVLQNSDPLLLDVLQNSDPLLLDKNDQVLEDASSILSQEVVSVRFPPIKFARYDDDHDGFIEKSLESNKFNRLDVVKNVKCEEWQAQERKQTKENSDDIICQVQQKRNKRKFMEIVPKQDLNVEEKINKIPIMVQEMDQNRKLTTNTLKELSRNEKENEEKKNDFKFNRGKGGKISNLPLKQPWSSMFPPSPPSPPPPVWHNFTSMWQLEAHEFEAVTGLCRNEAAAEMRRQRAAPKPIARVLRQKRKKKTN